METQIQFYENKFELLEVEELLQIRGGDNEPEGEPSLQDGDFD